MSKRLLEAIAVTAELTGTQLSEGAARVMAADLAQYPEVQVLKALEKCRKELKGRLTIADVITRLDDGRPGAEEAWAMIPRSEADTVVWTEEMAEALGVAQPLLDEGDPIGARMAFKESYSKLVQKARDARRPVKWTASLGHDARSREQVLLQAAEMGRLPAAHVAGLLPYLDAAQIMSKMPVAMLEQAKEAA